MSFSGILYGDVSTKADYEEIFNRKWLPRVKCSDYYAEGMDDVLKAVFYQYSEASKLLNSHLNGDECCFNYTEDWTSNINILRGQIYECYLDICQEFNIPPIELGDVNKYDKFPYISYGELIESSKIASICFLHLRDMQVKYISSLSIYPSDEEISDVIDGIIEQDSTISLFLVLMFAMSISVEESIACYRDLYSAYDMRVIGFLSIVAQKDTKEVEELFDKSTTIFEDKLRPYTQRLKDLSAIPDNWEFSCSEMALSTIPYVQRLGEDIFMKVCRLWNEPNIRRNVELTMKVFESMTDPNLSGVDVIRSLYECKMGQKKYFVEKDSL